MISWDAAQLDCQDLASDTTATSLTFFKRMMNSGYKIMLAELNRPVIERTQTASTVASQQYYQLPQDFNFMKTLACSCEELEKKGQLPKSFQFKTTLDLCSYNSADDFVHQQKGDSHLPDNH